VIKHLKYFCYYYCVIMISVSRLKSTIMKEFYNFLKRKCIFFSFFFQFNYINFKIKKMKRFFFEKLLKKKIIEKIEI